MKKKLLLIVSMLAVTFMFAGCSASDDNGVKFAYNDQEIAQVAKDAQRHIRNMQAQMRPTTML